MFSSHGGHGFRRKYRLFLALYCDWPPVYWKCSIRSLHSIHQFKPKNQFRPNKKIRKSVDPVEKNVVDPKIYMRDTIANISNILRYSTWDSAQEQLRRLSVKWDSYTVNQVLKAHPPMEKSWLFFNWVSRLCGFKHDQFTYTTMLDIFGEAGRISSMNYVFQQMLEKGIKIDAVTYTSLLHRFSNAGDVDRSIKAWTEMKTNNCRPTVVSYTAYMKVLFDNDRTKEAFDVYKEMLQTGCSPNCCTYTVLMEYLAGSGKFDAVIEMFSKMQESGIQPDKAACNILVEKCCKAGETRTITQILQYMRDSSLVLRYPVFLQALVTLRTAGVSDALLREVNPHIRIESICMEEMVKFRATNTDTYSTIDKDLASDLLMKKKFVAIDHLLLGMVDNNTRLDPSIVSNIIMVNCSHCRTNGALLGFEYCVKMGINVQRTVFLALVGVFIRTNSFSKVVEVVGEMTAAGHSLGTDLGSLLIYRLGYARRPVSAAKVFDLLPDDQKNTSAYTALIGAYFSVGGIDKGLKIFKAMQERGIQPAFGTYSVLLAGLEKSGRVCEAEIFRKERKSLQTSGGFQNVAPMEEKLCDFLFAWDRVC